MNTRRLPASKAWAEGQRTAGSPVVADRLLWRRNRHFLLLTISTAPKLVYLDPPTLGVGPLALSYFAVKPRHVFRRITTPKDRIGGNNGFDGLNFFAREPPRERPASPKVGRACALPRVAPGAAVSLTPRRAQVALRSGFASWQRHKSARPQFVLDTVLRGEREEIAEVAVLPQCSYPAKAEASARREQAKVFSRMPVPQSRSS